MPHPAQKRATPLQPHARPVEIPIGEAEVELTFGRRRLRLTNLEKVFWPELGITKRDVLQYYADLAPVLFPHLCDRAQVIKRYPGGAGAECFLMKRIPVVRPDWVETCTFEHAPEHVIDFPIVQDLASLLWIVNLGCIDLNPWHATCDDVDRPDSLHFDLDPTPGSNFEHVREAALLVREALDELEIQSYPKTSGLRGIHIYVPIVRGPKQKEVWTFVKALATAMEARYPNIITADCRASKRPRAHVLVDYNRNGWGRALASVYSVRPAPRATVSTPVTWDEVERGVDAEGCRIDTIPERVSRLGDLWKPLLQQRGRLDLNRLIK